MRDRILVQNSEGRVLGENVIFGLFIESYASPIEATYNKFHTGTFKMEDCAPNRLK